MELVVVEVRQIKVHFRIGTSGVGDGDLSSANPKCAETGAKQISSDGVKHDVYAFAVGGFLHGTYQVLLFKIHERIRIRGALRDIGGDNGSALPMSDLNRRATVIAAEDPKSTRL